VTKLFGFRVVPPQQEANEDCPVTVRDVEVTFEPVEDPAELYLYSEEECAISCLSVQPIKISASDEMLDPGAGSAVRGDLLAVSLRNTNVFYLYF